MSVAQEVLDKVMLQDRRLPKEYSFEIRIPTPNYSSFEIETPISSRNSYSFRFIPEVLLRLKHKGVLVRFANICGCDPLNAADEMILEARELADAAS